MADPVLHAREDYEPFRALFTTSRNSDASTAEPAPRRGLPILGRVAAVVAGLALSAACLAVVVRVTRVDDDRVDVTVLDGEVGTPRSLAGKPCKQKVMFGVLRTRLGVAVAQ